jgi:hypothetical protein
MKRICVSNLVLATLALGLAFAAASSLAHAAPALSTDPDNRNGALRRNFNKEFQDLTPSERIAIRAAAKTAYKNKTLDSLVVCADPGNMPFSNEKGEGFENKIAELLGKATGAKVTFYWRPSYERGMMRQTFGTGM